MADDDADDEDNDEADPATWRILSSLRILLWTDAIFFRHSMKTMLGLGGSYGS